jgi:hypothetical protein
MPGLFDEHGKRRAKGVLDVLFYGIVRPEGPVRQLDTSFEGDKEDALAREDIRWTSGHSPMINPPLQVGRGHARYLGYSIIDYAKLRLKGGGKRFRDAIGGTLALVGVKPAAKVTLAGGPPLGCEVITYHRGTTRYIAIMRNPEYHAGELGDLGYGDNHLFEVPAQVTVHFDKPVNAKELLSGQSFPNARTVALTLDPWKPLIMEVK